MGNLEIMLNFQLESASKVPASEYFYDSLGRNESGHPANQTVTTEVFDGHPKATSSKNMVQEQLVATEDPLDKIKNSALYDLIKDVYKN